MKNFAQLKKSVIPNQKEQERMESVASFAINLVKTEASKYTQVKGVEFAGSYAKGTWLPKAKDIDIFVKFDENTDIKKFETIGKKIGFDSLKKFKPYVRYSDHPYVEAFVKGGRVNVVPCFDVKSGNWKSAADRSPFHTKYIIESLDQTQKNDVRLLKKFLIDNELYGAEIARQAFSGYVAEVLILHYGNFFNVIKAAANFKRNQIIGNPTKQFDTPLVIIDPIDSNRNLGTAISIESVGKLVLLSRIFLEKPSLFFRPKIKSTKRNLNDALVVKFNYKKRSPDVIWGQLKRAVNSIAKQLELAGFNVLRKSEITDELSEASLLFLLHSVKIEKTILRKGPEFFWNKDSEKFISKNSKRSKLLWIGDNGKILSLHNRPENDAKKFLQNLLKNGIISSGIPDGLFSDFKKGFKIQTGKQIKNKSIKKALSNLVTTDEITFYSTKKIS